jgi:hypothetical protein
MLNPGWAIIVPARLYVVTKGLKATAGGRCRSRSAVRGSGATQRRG